MNKSNPPWNAQLFNIAHGQVFKFGHTIVCLDCQKVSLHIYLYIWLVSLTWSINSESIFVTTTTTHCRKELLETWHTCRNKNDLMRFYYLIIVQRTLLLNDQVGVTGIIKSLFKEDVTETIQPIRSVAIGFRKKLFKIRMDFF